MAAVSLWDSVAEMPEDYAITHDEVHVWMGRIGWHSEVIQSLAKCLASDELERAERFRFERDRERHIVGRALVRMALGRLLNASPHSLQFSYSNLGKPYLSGDLAGRPVRFNLSHSGKLVLVGIAVGRDLGIDVERVRGDFNFDPIAARFFSLREKADLAALSGEQKRDAFFRCWCRKEAFVKAKGDGLSLPLDGFDVSLRPGEAAVLLGTRPDVAEVNRWVIRELDVGPGYQAALAVQGRGWKLKMMEWQPAHGLSGQ